MKTIDHAMRWAWVFAIGMSMALPGCGRHGEQGRVTENDGKGAANAADGGDARVPAVVDRWDQLMPANDIFQRPPPRIGIGGLNPQQDIDAAAGDGGPSSIGGIAIDHSGTSRAQQFGSSAVVSALEGRRFSLDGYVVPLENDDQGRVSELLFVPFYGACIHVPPPPPNQIIHVVLGRPIDVPELWDAFHLEGRLHVGKFDADIASASYDALGASIALVPG